MTHKANHTVHVPFKTIGRRIGIVSVAIIILSTGVWFVRAIVLAWKVQTTANVSCNYDSNPALPFSYIQYNIKDQAIEPFFRGTFFIDLGPNTSGLSRIEVVTSSGRGYGPVATRAEFISAEPTHEYMMSKESDEITLVRTSGSHRDFPFDSAEIDFDTTFKPPTDLRFIMIRNFNTSFYVPCDTAKGNAR